MLFLIKDVIFFFLYDKNIKQEITDILSITQTLLEDIYIINTAASAFIVTIPSIVEKQFPK